MSNSQPPGHRKGNATRSIRNFLYKLTRWHKRSVAFGRKEQVWRNLCSTLLGSDCQLSAWKSLKSKSWPKQKSNPNAVLSTFLSISFLRNCFLFVLLSYFVLLQHFCQAFSWGKPLRTPLQKCWLWTQELNGTKDMTFGQCSVYD